MGYDKLEEILKSKGITSYKLCKDLGLGSATITNWKKGRYAPKVDKLKKIADYLGIPVSALTDENVDNNLNDDELRLLSLFNSLNKEGQQRIMEYARLIAGDNIYKKCDMAESEVV